VLPRRPLFALAPALLAALGLGLAAEGGASAGDPQVRDAKDGGTDAKARIPPDPPALAERVQWVFDLRWDSGEVYLLQIHKLDMGEVHPTARMMGRFALELFEGPTLIERARFDFPMLGPPETADAGFMSPIRLEPRLKSRIGVLFPATKRGTRLELWDRATDRRWSLPWPPEERTYGGPKDLARVLARDLARDAGAR
jgi:hypothetical protein